MAATGSNGAKRRSGRGLRRAQRTAARFRFTKRKKAKRQIRRFGRYQARDNRSRAYTCRHHTRHILLCPRSSQGVIAAIVPLLFGIFGIGMYAVPVLCAALGVCVIAIRKDNSRTGHDRLRSRCRIRAAFVHSPCRICKIDSLHELRRGCFPCMVQRQPPAQRRRFFRRKPCISFCKVVRRHGRMCCTGGH